MRAPSMAMTAPTAGRRLVVSQGEPLGVGPELLLHAAAQGWLAAEDLVVADPGLLEARARAVPAEWALRGWEAVAPRVTGDLAPGAGAIPALERAVDLVAAAGGAAALVTAPIDKARCAAQGFAFPGHTEYLAHRAGVGRVVMVMAGPRLRVALATTHLPLAEVPRRLDATTIVEVASILAAGLRTRFGIGHPRVGILGLNPHAGEGGLLGHEDSAVIAPAIEELRLRDHEARFEGPVPADAAFPRHAAGHYDALVAMYHDQGLAPFKLLHFHDGVNLTLGLPWIRTSPDHGTAADLVGTGRVDPSSFHAALELARTLA